MKRFQVKVIRKFYKMDEKELDKLKDMRARLLERKKKSKCSGEELILLDIVNDILGKSKRKKLKT